MLRKPFGVVERRFAADVVLQQVVQFRAEGGIVLRLKIRLREFAQRSRQRFGHILPAIDSIMHVHGKYSFFAQGKACASLYYFMMLQSFFIFS